MAIGLLATITVQEGKNAEFEEAFLNLTEQVRSNEAGNIFYALHRSPVDPQVYRVMEQYENQEAPAAHGKTEYFLKHSGQLPDPLARPPDIEVIEAATR